MAFSGLTTFGGSFLSKFECSQMPHILLEHITFVDTLGVLSGEKQRTQRSYDFTGVISWFAHPCEDHNHLSFECPFSERVWTYIKGKINVDWPSIQWNDLIHLIAKSVNGKSLGAVITKLAFTCTVYQLWIAKNNKIFSKDMLPEEVVINCIVDIVRFRVMHITNMKSHHTDSWYLSSWRLPHTMLKSTAAEMRNVSSQNEG